MRTALLIGLMAMGVAGSAQAQAGYKPYQPPKPYSSDRDPYDLPSAWRTNPYDRDYSKPAPGTSGPGYRNVDGSLPSQRNGNSSSGGFYSGYGARPSAPPSYGSNRQNPACSRPGVVC